MKFVKDTVSAKHWESARDLLGTEPPTLDDLPTTLAGEPLDSVDKVREFLATGICSLMSPILDTGTVLGMNRHFRNNPRLHNTKWADHSIRIHSEPLTD